ncbi:hypothetical protein AMS68_000019 [Peltaster fructicola]|uniref:Porphobilinogen deaminase n=1 Tax=Peltaster fructicola TaxID=286661 RepID=A0A6H0XIG3_9PEZI|nr:hypothetical protein AMS68_000019 [Peltaster fructicola]
MATQAETTPTTQQVIHVGTRRSLLARVQADEVVAQLRAAWPSHTFEIHAMATAGDNNQTTALYKFNDKALWTQDLEVLLQSGELDVIVHCLKDMPTQLPAELALAGVTKRRDPRDGLVIKASLVEQYKTLSDLPAGSIVGTSSLRRTAQLKKFYPHLKFADVRGNVGTRLAKLDDPQSQYSATVLAVAGLDRLGMLNRVSMYLSKHNGGMLYAVGQGALGLEIRKNDTKMEGVLKPIICDRSMQAGLAERSLMRTLEGGCSVPIGVETEWVSKKTSLTSTEASGVAVGVKPAENYEQLSGVAEDDTADGLTDELIMRAIVISLDGQDAVEVEMRQRVTSIAEADEFGWNAAKKLVEKGADKILEKITLDRGIIAAQGNA